MNYVPYLYYAYIIYAQIYIYISVCVYILVALIPDAAKVKTSQAISISKNYYIYFWYMDLYTALKINGQNSITTSE